jgi:hypothetical protein
MPTRRNNDGRGRRGIGKDTLRCKIEQATAKGENKRRKGARMDKRSIKSKA